MPEMVSGTRQRIEDLDEALRAQHQATKQWRQGSGAEQWKSWTAIRDRAAHTVVDKYGAKT